MFKTQQEIWDHLSIEGNKVCAGESGTPVWLYEGFVVDGGGRRDYSFTNPAFWQPYTEPSWEDKLDGTGENAVWCWLSDATKYPDIHNHRSLGRVVSFTKDSPVNYRVVVGNLGYVAYNYATPLSKEDKQILFPS